jgi:hypothetical protein
MSDEPIIINPPKPARKLQAVRPIDQNTNYDVAARLIKLGREIQRGEQGAVDSCVIGLLTENKKGEICTKAFHYRKGDGLRAYYIIDYLKERFMGR